MLSHEVIRVSVWGDKLDKLFKEWAENIRIMDLFRLRQEVPKEEREAYDAYVERKFNELAGKEPH